MLPGAQSERIGECPNALTGGGLSGFRALRAEKEDLPIQGKPAAPGQECRPSHTIWVWFHQDPAEQPVPKATWRCVPRAPTPLTLHPSPTHVQAGAEASGADALGGVSGPHQVMPRNVTLGASGFLICHLTI